MIMVMMSCSAKHYLTNNELQTFFLHSQSENVMYCFTRLVALFDGCCVSLESLLLWEKLMNLEEFQEKHRCLQSKLNFVSKKIITENNSREGPVVYNEK